MDRGMQMGEDGGPSGATPLREPSALEWIAHLVGSIYCHGGFRAETENERLLEARLIDAGFRYRSTDEVVAGEARLRAPEAASAEGSPSPLPEWFDKPQTHPDYCDICCDDSEAVIKWQSKHVALLRDLVGKLAAPSHPSGPSQDSQEVREAAQHLIFIQDRLDEMTGLKREELNHVTIADLLSEKDKAIKAVRAALSQSPKGAAGACEFWVCFHLGKPTPYISTGSADDLANLREGYEWVRVAAVPSAPKTGLRGASRLKEGVTRAQFTRFDMEVWPECDNAEYLDYERRETGLSKGVISYGYRQELPPGGMAWIKKAEAFEPAPGDVGEAGGAA